MPGGGGKGGKGGGANSTIRVINGPIDADVTVEGLDDIGVTLQGGDNPVAAEVAQDLTLQGGTPIKTEATQDLTLQGGTPIKTEAAQDLTLQGGKPIKTENTNSVSLDVKPVTVDLCTTTNAGKLPQGVIRQPYRHHFGMTWFGVEFLGFTVSGEAQTEFDELPKKAAVDWPAQQQSERPRKARPKDHGGLRIRID